MVLGFVGVGMVLDRIGVGLGVSILAGLSIVSFTLDSSKGGLQGLLSGSSREGWESKVVVWVSFVSGV